MKLILTADVPGLGAPGDTVEVRDGYGRNYLLPQGKAIVATKGAQKQVATIQRAQLAREIRGVEHAKLVIAGEEISKYPSLRRLVHRFQLHQHVRFFGFVPEATLAALYRLASVFVFPSLYEGFGLPPLEAMAAGAPVVTSNVSSLPEVVGDAALLIDPMDAGAIAEAMGRVLGDAQLRADLVARGHARVRTFSWDRSVARIREIYDEVSGSPRD